MDQAERDFAESQRAAAVEEHSGRGGALFTGTVQYNVNGEWSTAKPLDLASCPPLEIPINITWSAEGSKVFQRLIARQKEQRRQALAEAHRLHLLIGPDRFLRVDHFGRAFFVRRPE